MKKHLLITIFVLLAIQMHADNYYGKRISIENGLSQASVTCLQYDNQGSLWIGTRFGLNEYRNGKIRNFSGLNCYINGLYCDTEDRLWVLTDKGVFVYDRVSDTFYTICQTAAICMHEKGHKMYIGGNAGIAVYDKSTKEITGGQSPVWTDYFKIYEYNGDLIYIDKRNGVTRHGNGGEMKLNIPHLEGNTVLAACMFDSTLVLCILGEGILMYNLETLSVIRYIQPGEKGLGRDLILSAELIDGNIWLGTDGNGIMVMSPETGETDSFYDKIKMHPGTEVPSSVTCIYVDPLSNIWIGGVYFGVTGLKKTSVGSFLPKDIINSMMESSDGNLYIGTDGSGLYRYTAEYALPEHIASTSGMKITTITDYTPDEILIGAYNEGFYIINRYTGKRKPLIIVDNQTNAIECLYGNSPEATRFPDGRILFFAVNNYIHDPKRGKFTLLNDSSEGDARDLHVVDGEARCRYTYCKTGIYRIDEANLSVDLVYNARNDGESINTLVCDGNNGYYGSDNGLFSIDLLSSEVKPIATSLFTRVTELCNGKDGSLWIGADNSLFFYKDGIFKLMGENVGVNANEITSSTLTQSGIVFLGGSTGFLEIDGNEESMKENDPERLFCLHDLSLDGKNLEAKDGKLKVPYNFSNLGITIPVYGSDPLEKMVYRYKVEGSTSFSVESYEDNINIPSMKAGNYTIWASCLQSKGHWSEPQRVLEVRVLRPWYLSTGMVIVYLIILVSALTALSLYIRKRTLEQLEREMRAKDSQFISKFEKYIEEHLDDNNLNVDQIAVELAMSRATLYTKVKHTYAAGVGEYIETKRMEKAKEMLSKTDLSIAEIADKIGYSTPRYFSTRFKIYTGESPLPYRRTHKK